MVYDMLPYSGEQIKKLMSQELGIVRIDGDGTLRRQPTAEYLRLYVRRTSCVVATLVEVLYEQSITPRPHAGDLPERDGDGEA